MRSSAASNGGAVRDRRVTWAGFHGEHGISQPAAATIAPALTAELEEVPALLAAGIGHHYADERTIAELAWVAVAGLDVIDHRTVHGPFEERAEPRHVTARLLGEANAQLASIPASVNG